MKLIRHLKERGMDPSLYCGVGYSYSATKITFPLWNLSGQMVGYQAYRPNKVSKKNNNPKYSRYFTFLKEKDGVFGLETLDYSKKIVYIVEGIFKAGTLHRLGYNAIAVLTNHPKRLKPWFKILRAKGLILIAIGDNDEAGNKLVSTIKSGFCSPKDLDELTDKEIHDLLQDQSQL